MTSEKKQQDRVTKSIRVKHSPYTLLTMGDAFVFGGADHDSFRYYTMAKDGCSQSSSSEHPLSKYHPVMAVANQTHFFFVVQNRSGHQRLCVMDAKGEDARILTRCKFGYARCMAADAKEVVLISSDGWAHWFRADPTLKFQRRFKLGTFPGQAHIALTQDELVLTSSADGLVGCVSRQDGRPLRHWLNKAMKPGPLVVVSGDNEVWVLDLVQSHRHYPMHEIHVFALATGELRRTLDVTPADAPDDFELYSLCIDDQRVYVGVVCDAHILSLELKTTL